MFILAFIFIVVLIFKVVFINITTNVNINMYTNLSNRLSRQEGEREARGRHSLSRFFFSRKEKKEGERKVSWKPTTLAFPTLERETEGEEEGYPLILSSFP